MLLLVAVVRAINFRSSEFEGPCRQSKLCCMSGSSHSIYCVSFKQHTQLLNTNRFNSDCHPGLVGGWIVQHLLTRGEDPRAIRILDIAAPTRSDIVQALELGVEFIKTDVSDAAAVKKAFDAPWPAAVAKLPLTVFHTVAIITVSSRTQEFYGPYKKINVDGTSNVVEAAKKAGADCLIATGSASIGLKPVQYFMLPWQKWPEGWLQVIENADPDETREVTIKNFPANYMVSKIVAETIVKNADSERDGFRTGVIRPGHGIYGHGVKNDSSLTWSYMRRGGAPT
jgi:nucleoside-diphosphate-sugar epimerase